MAICGNTTETCPYIHLRINLVLFDWTYRKDRRTQLSGNAADGFSSFMEFG